ncbi:MAG TPA: NIPSNAP family protein [Kiritimatiellia bacterium]|nr:NIPSNAP family protein [Kiritimatiellia bacterium]HPS07411.1 NIPSNAP family protein [Kiritimatiellia bacterium]
MMRRRGFLAAAGAAVVTAIGAQGQDVAAPAQREFIEIKTYTCSSVEKRDALMGLFDTALIPALNRQDIKKVGVFWSSGEVNDGNAAYATNLYVVIPHPALESFVSEDRRLLADAQFMRDAAALFGAPMAAPLYDTCSSALLQAFATCPQVSQVTASADRVLQLRIYNSYTIERNVRKIEMFEQGGEIGIFRACGMQPVFFGQALAGDKLANLTYMLGFANKEEKDAAWKRFRGHPDWNALKADPRYKDTANKITNILLRPSRGSQL